MLVNLIFLFIISLLILGGIFFGTIYLYNRNRYSEMLKSSITENDFYSVWSLFVFNRFYLSNKNLKLALGYIKKHEHL